MSKESKQLSIEDDYSSYIHLSKYARWLDKEGRRENWEETVDRYVSFFEEKFPNQKKILRETIYPAILKQEIMPSMRALMTAGKALERDHVAGYNCAYIHIDNQKAFDEILYVLMCGTGVGFSVERQFITKLPEISEELYPTETVISVADSKIGWAKSYRELLSLLWAGQIPEWDLSKLRPAGAILKTFGGRSSGPEPLGRLFDFTVSVFKAAKGRKLTSIECHDLVCKIAEIVVVGGVRRCLTEGTLVDTNKGWINIEDINPDIHMVVFNNTEYNIKELFDNGIQKTQRINLTDGTSLVCTKEHKMYVYNHDKDIAEWRQTNELNEGNFSMISPKQPRPENQE